MSGGTLNFPGMPKNIPPKSGGVILMRAVRGMGFVKTKTNPWQRAGGDGLYIEPGLNGSNYWRMTTKSAGKDKPELSIK